MENAGWEMRPAGWIALFVLAVVLAYFINQQLQRHPKKNPEEPSGSAPE
jgi:hypothetical protein